MRQLPTIQGESLDDAVNRLLEARNKGQSVFLIFKKKNLLSDTVTLDDAYLEVYGCTRKEYLSKTNEKRKLRYTPSDVVRDIRVSILIGAKDLDTNQYYSEVAKTYIFEMNAYSNYCKDTTKDDWKQSIEYYIYNIGSTKPNSEEEIYTDEQIVEYLTIYEKVGEIMESIDNNESWEEISKMVALYGLSDKDTNELKDLMLHFSPMGEEFKNNVFGPDPDVLKKAPKKDKKKD